MLSEVTKNIYTFKSENRFHAASVAEMNAESTTHIKIMYNRHHQLSLTNIFEDVFTSEPVASRIVGWALSGAHEMHSTTCSCSRSSALHSFDATTQTRTVWSLELLAIRVPSWLGRTMRTHSLWPVNVFTQYL